MCYFLVWFTSKEKCMHALVTSVFAALFLHHCVQECGGCEDQHAIFNALSFSVQLPSNAVHTGAAVVWPVTNRLQNKLCSTLLMLWTHAEHPANAVIRAEASLSFVYMHLTTLSSLNRGPRFLSSCSSLCRTCHGNKWTDVTFDGWSHYELTSRFFL